MSLGQCDWVERHGTEGYLCCAEKRDHEGQHRNTYDQSQGRWPSPSPYEWWFPLKEWERNFGAAARACYRQPHPWANCQLCAVGAEHNHYGV